MRPFLNFCVYRNRKGKQLFAIHWRLYSSTIALCKRLSLKTTNFCIIKAGKYFGGRWKNTGLWPGTIFGKSPNAEICPERSFLKYRGLIITWTPKVFWLEKLDGLYLLENIKEVDHGRCCLSGSGAGWGHICCNQPCWPAIRALIIDMDDRDCKELNFSVSPDLFRSGET